MPDLQASGSGRDDEAAGAGKLVESDSTSAGKLVESDSTSAGKLVESDSTSQHRGPDAGPPEPRRVLVIEDDRSVLETLVHVLIVHGFAVTATGSVVGALSLVRRQQPDLIILDLGLPYRSGVAFLTELKADQETQHIPVIVVSALLRLLPTEHRALVAGALAKPFDIHTLMTTIRTALEAAG